MRVGFSADSVRSAEAAVLKGEVPGTLMKRASAAVAQAVVATVRRVHGRLNGARIVVLVGPGNNGGDGLFIAAMLHARGLAVTAVLVADDVHAEGIAECRLAGVPIKDATWLASTPAETVSVVVDAMFGLSGRTGLSGAYAEAAAWASKAVWCVAVDVPSGLPADGGPLAPADVVMPVDETLCIGAYKPCHLLPPTSSLCGTLTLLDIDLPTDSASPSVRSLDAHDIATLWPQPDQLGHKYSRGVLGVVAGSDRYPGAGVLTVAGALRAGVGMVRAVAKNVTSDRIGLTFPEAIVTSDRAADAGRVQAWAVGPGIEPGNDRALADVRYTLTSGNRVVADAGALPVVMAEGRGNALPGAGRTVITPHAGEAATMLGCGRAEVEAAPVDAARQLTRELGVVTVVKGPTTVIACPDQSVYVQEDSTPWLATAGAGDVLTGVIGAVLAAGVDAGLAAALGVSVHGRAARLASGGGPIIASDVAAAVPTTLRDLFTG